MHERCYATTGDYSNFHGERAAEGFERAWLVRASRRVDRNLIGARYPIDDRGYPTDPAHRRALRDATCAQAKAMNPDANGDQWDTVAIGDVNLSRTSRPVWVDDGRSLVSDAHEILLLAGMFALINPRLSG